MLWTHQSHHGFQCNCLPAVALHMMLMVQDVSTMLALRQSLYKDQWDKRRRICWHVCPPLLHMVCNQCSGWQQADVGPDGRCCTTNSNPKAVCTYCTWCNSTLQLNVSTQLHPNPKRLWSDAAMTIFAHCWATAFVVWAVHEPLQHMPLCICHDVLTLPSISHNVSSPLKNIVALVVPHWWVSEES